MWITSSAQTTTSTPAIAIGGMTRKGCLFRPYRREQTERYTNVVGSETHLFSPSFLFTARFTMMRFTNVAATGGPNVAQSTGLVDVFPPFRGRDFLPPFSIAGYASLSQSGSFMGPEYYLIPTIDFQKIAGRHTLAFGGGYTYTTFLTDQTHGGENFSSAQTAFGSGTGDGLASFLLGLPFSANRVGGPSAWTFAYHSYSWYVQDTFRFNAKLTFNYGLRWDYIAPMHVSPGLGTLDFSTGNYVFDHTNPITGQPANIRSGGVEPDYRGYQPRFGIAYQLTSKTVLRSSFGIFNDIFGANQQSRPVRQEIGLTPFLRLWRLQMPRCRILSCKTPFPDRR